uniref:Uncharacterized protein n=1 Tax=Anguilla anguilla TaxID=7936 RepID=A0A0E9QAR2_ANGAN
MSQPVVLFKLF